MRPLQSITTVNQVVFLKGRRNNRLLIKGNREANPLLSMIAKQEREMSQTRAFTDFRHGMQNFTGYGQVGVIARLTVFGEDMTSLNYIVSVYLNGLEAYTKRKN